ncbi:MAG TPA: DNA polymerase III subunit delta [Phycisphaerales bacterium]|nr:DNA polymerase III subunit delta [Phycisphaerales bacterium]
MARRATDSGPELTGATRVVIVHGPDRFLQGIWVQKLREALEQAHGAVETFRFDAGAPGGLSVAEVLDECRSLGLLQQHKLVIVDNADALLKAEDEADPGPARGPKRKSNRQLVEAYAAEPSPSACLVFRADRWHKGNLDKAVEKVGAVIRCDPLAPEQAVAWAGKRIGARHGASIEPGAAAALVDSVGTDLGRLDSELAKLAVAAGPGNPVTPAHVRELVGRSRQEEFWLIQETLLAGDAEAALTHLRELIDVSRHDPVPLAWAFAELARKLHAMSRGLADGVPAMTIARAARAWGAVADLLARAGARVDPAAAAGLLEAAVRTNREMKSGVGDPVVHLETLAVRFSSVLASPGR